MICILVASQATNRRGRLSLSVYQGGSVVLRNLRTLDRAKTSRLPASGARFRARLQISRSSVSARRKHPDFPVPLAEAASGPVWDLDEIDDYEHLRPGDRSDPDFFLQTQTHGSARSSGSCAVCRLSERIRPLRAALRQIAARGASIGRPKHIRALRAHARAYAREAEGRWGG